MMHFIRDIQLMECFPLGLRRSASKFI